MPRYTVIGLTMPDGRLAIADVHDGACVSLCMGNETHGMVRFTHFTVAADAGKAVTNAISAHRAWYTDHSGLPGATALMSAAVTDPGFMNMASPIKVPVSSIPARVPVRKRQSWWRRLLGR